MEQPSNGLNTSTAYDLACRYNNLFQFNPTAAALAYGMFNSQKTQNSVNASTHFVQSLNSIATSSLPSSSSSNQASSPTSSLSSLTSNSSNLIKTEPKKQELNLQENEEANKKDDLIQNEDKVVGKDKNLYDTVSDNGSVNMENSDNEDNLGEENEEEQEEEDDERDEDENKNKNETNVDKEEIEMDKMQQKLSLEAEKSINTCLNNTDEINLSLNEQDSEDEESPNKKMCISSNQTEEHSLSSLMNSLNKAESGKFKLINRNDLFSLKKNLIKAVNQAIESTLDNYIQTRQDLEKNKPECINKKPEQVPIQQQAPKRIRVNEKSSKNYINNSQNFNVSKLLSKDNLHLINQKRKLFNQAKAEPMKALHHSSSSPILNESHYNSAFKHQPPQIPPAPSLLTPNNQPSQAPKTHLSHFYSAMTHLNNQSNHNNPFLNMPSSCSSSTSSNSSTTSTSSILNTSNPNQGPIQSFLAQQHQQFLIAAAQAAANGQNPNYLQMAAAANRLFTPYLLENSNNNTNSTMNQNLNSNQPLVKPNFQLNTPNQTPPSHFSSNNFNMFGSPHKRRRTKVTDTRLSPRNPALRQGGFGVGMNLNKNRDDLSSVNNDDEQDMEDDEQNQNLNGANNNQEDDSASSGCNESGSTTGSGVLNNNQLTNGYEINNETSEYTGYQTSTLSSLHLRKAKLMFFFTRYPSSTILRNFFPDVKFNKANTAQLVKWFSNFREFFYIQMEKFARQHLAEGIRNAEEIHVDSDSEIFRALNSHYNRNNQLEIPPTFCFVIQATLREFFKAIQDAKDLDPSWKKAIYKIIARMDDQIPEYFKSIQWMESLETNI